jgi:hypothetical protein
MWLTWHDSCDLWTLGGHTCLSLQDIAHRMDAIPCIWETMDDECCTLRMKNVVFGGSLASLEDQVAPLSTWTFYLLNYELDFLCGLILLFSSTL